MGGACQPGPLAERIGNVELNPPRFAYCVGPSRDERLLVAQIHVTDLFVCAKDLLVAAMVWVLGHACSSRMCCRGIAATPAARRAMGVRGRLARQSWEANSRTNVFPVLASWLLGSREIRLPAKAKACDVCAKAALRISTLHRRCLHDVI